MDAPADDDSVVDVAFPLDGRQLPRDHALPLAQALAAQLAWLAQEPGVGIHPVKVVAGAGVQGMLSRRARLLVRSPGSRAAALAALAGRTISVGGCELRLGAPQMHALLPHSTVFAPFVAAAGDDEGVFMHDVANSLDAMQVHGHSVCGLRHRIGAPGPVIHGFSLMLHGLTGSDSMRLQRSGLGPHRLLGCGIFVRHRSAAAVGL